MSSASRVPLVVLDEPRELVPGLLARLGGEAPAAACGGEVPAGRGGTLPLNVYLLTTRDEALLVDTAPAALHPALSEQVLELTGGRRLSVLLTRNDPEATGGLGTLLPRGEVAALHYYGGGSLLEWLSDAAEGDDPSGDLSGTVAVGSPWEIELGSGRLLRVVRPPLAVLNTVWVHDAATGALFSSDAFGIGRVAGEDLVDVVGSTSGAESRAWLAARFDWVELLDSDRLAEDLGALLDPMSPELVCPSHGRVVQGRGAIARYLGATIAALSPAGEPGERGKETETR